jgi:hypothetical protein
MNLAPIVLFVYNRPMHTKQTIEALQKNELASESQLYIYSDAAKNAKATESVCKVREYIKTINGFKKTTIIEREKNLGLANSVIDGVTRIINKYGKIVVLEDDLITSPYFLKYMNDALDFYQNNKNIYSVTGFSFSTEFMNFPTNFIDDVYLNIRPMSWGWATWKREWLGIDWEIKNFNDFLSSKKRMNQFNKGGTDLAHMLKAQMNGQIDSWYIRWTYNAFLKGKYTIYPSVSFVNNIGHDDTGVHCKEDSESILSHSELNPNSKVNFKRDVVLKSEIVSAFNKAFNFTNTVRVKLFIKEMINHVKTN